MPWNGIREKSHRLDKSLYRGQIQCAFSVQTIGRDPYFDNDRTFKEHEQMLLSALESWSCDAHIYMFMPDHVHLIIEGCEDYSDVRGCVLGYKQRAGFAFRRDSPGKLWQKDFYDHIIRSELDYRTQMNYVLMNPVRAGLVESWKQYPYWGSTKYDKNALLMGFKR